MIEITHHESVEVTETDDGKIKIVVGERGNGREIEITLGMAEEVVRAISSILAIRKATPRAS